MTTSAEVLSRIEQENLANNEKYIKTDIYSAQEGETAEYSSSQTDTVFLSPSSGNKIIVTGFHIHSSGNVGEITVEFDGGDFIGKLFSSQNTRIAAGNFKKEGAVDTDVLVQGGGDSFVVMLNYIEVEA